MQKDLHSVPDDVGVGSTQNLHVLAATPLVSPRQLKNQLPISEASAQTIVTARDAIKHILLGQDKRVLAIVGPCSIHDEKGALDYAARLNELRQAYESTMLIVMRVYFEKPRTTLGWKGLIYDPHLNDSFDFPAGLRIARRILLEINEIGLPAATEFLDPFIPQYIADLVTWAAIGARTTESQTHRQLASGLSMPVGFKNNTDGNLQVAINAELSARMPQSFLGIDEDGRTAIIQTTGNRWGHTILRGGTERPNYDPQNVADSMALLKKAGLPPTLMVDCSHANSGKKHERQEVVWNSVIEQRVAGNDALFGLMLESNIEEGRQELPSDLTKLRYGVSVTDECIGWSKTEQLLSHAHEALQSTITPTQPM